MKKVLIVEDEVAYRQVLADTLEKEQFEVVVAGEGMQGVAQVVKTHPDLILLDIMLPGGMNGFDFLERIKSSETTKHIPVIIITNVATEAKVASEIGADFYFIKSETSMAELIGKVKLLLGVK